MQKHASQLRASLRMNNQPFRLGSHVFTTTTQETSSTGNYSGEKGKISLLKGKLYLLFMDRYKHAKKRRIPIIFSCSNDGLH